MAAGAAAVVRRQRRRSPHLRNRLVPDAGALRGLFVGVDRRAAGHFHGGHVSGQLSAAALHLAQASPAEGLRASRDLRSASSACCCSSCFRSSATSTRRGAAMALLDTCCVGWSPASASCRRPLRWAPRSRPLRAGCRRRRPACRGSDFSTPATSPARSWARLLAGFYLLRVFDMSTATYVAVAINFAVGGLDSLVAARTPATAGVGDSDPDPAVPDHQSQGFGPIARSSMSRSRSQGFAPWPRR